VTQDQERNRAMLAKEADANAACIQRVQDYLARTGLNRGDFARRVGVGVSSLGFFIGGTYHNVAGTAVHLIKKLNEFMDVHPVTPLTRVMGEIYDTANVRLIRDTFEKLLPRPVAYMIYAPPGSQKSFVLEHQVAELNASEIANPAGRRAFYVYVRKDITPRALVKRICIACGCRSNNDVDAMLNNLRFEFRNIRAVLVFDEAQRLSIECLETIQELLDQPPFFSLLFAGTHDLRKRFDENSASWEHLNSRVIAKVLLPGLERKEAREIVEREVGPLLKQLPARVAEERITALIAKATVADFYNDKRPYINVRTLTNALNQIKAAAEAQPESSNKLEVA
jgi:DNA transposition AAA+ family ATPase